MPLSITILTEGSLTASVVGQGIVASIVPSQALLEVDVGVPGASATVSVGTTTTGEPGTDASVVNVGTTTNAIFDFTIPRGDKGEQGNAGNSATVNVGTTTTLSAGSSATVTNSGSTSAAIFNFGIPQGIKGDKGDTGNTGAGVAVGGTAGQVLAKIDGQDFNTEWVDGGASGDYLPLSGGIMSSGALIDFSADVDSNTSVLGAWGLGIDNANAGETAYIQANQIRTYNGDYVNGTSLTPNGINFNDETTQVTAYNPAVLDSYLPLAGGIMSGAIRFDNVGTQNIAKGSFDSGRGGYNGISLNCAVDYELNWQAGYLKALNSGGFNVPINVESDIVNTTIPDIDNQGTKSTFNSNGLSAIYYHEGGAENTFITNYGHSSIDHTFFDNPQNFHLNQNGVYGIGDGEVSWGVGIGGVTFPDATVQVTAYDPAVLNGYVPFISQGSQHITREIGDGEITVGYLDIGAGANEDSFIKLTSPDTGGSISINTTFTDSFIKFKDDTTQNTAFPPTGGTVSQYIDGTGGLQTTVVGDRYLTSSTSTLTCDSGNGKTMTVGTGLSYSRQQDITVSYSNAVHMHGTVLTYDSVTGVMTFDANTHSGSGTYSNWEVNVGGVAGAVLPVSGTAGQVLAKVNSVNFNTEWISLGSMSTEPASAYLSTASAVANYLTISNASATYLTQSSASSTYIAQASFATTAQAQAGTSTTTVVSPATLLDAKFFAGNKPLPNITFATGVSGIGAVSQLNQNYRLITAPTTLVGYANFYAFLANSNRGGSITSGFNFSKRITFGGRFNRNVVTPDASTVFRFSIGKSNTSAGGVGDLSERGIMIKQTGGNALQLLVHNGTTLTTVTSSFTPVNQQAYDMTIISDGAGNVTLYVNETSVATTAAGPTTMANINTHDIMGTVENTSVITNGAMSYQISGLFFQVNV